MLDPVFDFYKGIFYCIGRAIGHVVAWILWPFRTFSKWLRGSGWFIKIPVLTILVLLLLGLMIGMS